MLFNNYYKRRQLQRERSVPITVIERREKHERIEVHNMKAACVAHMSFHVVTAFACRQGQQNTSDNH